MSSITAHMTETTSTRSDTSRTSLYRPPSMIRSPSPSGWLVRRRRSSYSSLDSHERYHMSEEDEPETGWTRRSAPQSECSGPIRSKKFWFEDGTVRIRVDDTIYNLHGSIMTLHSKFFREKLPIPVVELCEPLSVKVSNFELLISLIYPTNFCATRSELDIEDWFCIASVAATLEFTSIQEAALETIRDKCDSLRLIELGRKHGVPEAVSSGFRALCLDKEHLSLTVGQTIGMKMVIQAARAREMLAKGSDWSDIESAFVL